MHSRARRALRWTFIVVFLLLAPAVILTTAGYRYNFAKKKFERTGVLLVDSDPNDVRVQVNDRLAGERTPLRVPRLAPGSYRLRVEKDGYHPWQKTVQVESRITTFMDRVTLLRAELPTIDAVPGIDNAAFSRDGRYAALVIASDAGREVRVRDLRLNTESLAFRSAAAAQALSISWSPREERLLIATREKTAGWYVWTAGASESPVDLNAASGLALTEVFWGQDNDRLYGAAGQNLYVIDPDDGSALPSGAAAKSGVVTRNRYFGIVTNGTASVLMQKNLGADALETFADLPSDAYRPLPSPTGRITYVSRQSGQLFTFDALADDPAATLFETRGQDGAWSADGKRLLYWNDLELRLYDAARGTDVLLTRLGEPVRGAAWDPRGERLAFLATDASLIAVEAEDRGGRLVTELAAHAGIVTFAPDANGETVRAVGAIGRQAGIWSLRLR